MTAMTRRRTYLGSRRAPVRGPTRPKIAFLIAASALALVVAGCGSSSKHGHALKGTRVAGVASPSGAAKPKNGDLGQLSRVSLGISPHIKGIDNVPITQAIPALSGDLNQFWSQEFANSGVQWPTVQEQLVQSQPVQTACGKPIAPTDPAQLCDTSTAAVFYWTVPWMQQNVDTDPGGANLAVNMAYMYGLLVQDLFGFTKQVQSGQLSVSQYEEQSFCLSGVYARSLDNRRLLEQADFTTINGWLKAIAPRPAPGSGQATGQQIASAFVAGFQSGAPSACGVSGGTTTTTTTTTTGT